MEMDVSDKPEKACRTTGEASFSTIKNTGKKFAGCGKRFARAGRQRVCIGGTGKIFRLPVMGNGALVEGVGREGACNLL
jgi:hypothetical protein